MSFFSRRILQPFTSTATNFYCRRAPQAFAYQQVSFVKGDFHSSIFSRFSSHSSSSPVRSATNDFQRYFVQQFSKDYSTNNNSTVASVKKEKEIKEGVIIHSSKESYQVGKFLNEGAFGTVVKAKMLGTNQDVAIKIIKENHKEIGLMEFHALRQIQRVNADKCNLVKCIDNFFTRSHAFVVFEMLDQSLFEFMRERAYSPLRMSEIKVISRQLLVALKTLKGIGLAHTDIKLDNIMLVNHKSQPFRVKLIDFGLALRLEQFETGWIFQTMPYRAPEVRLGLPLSEGIDMWAMGSILALLFTGSSLYPRDTDYNVIRAMVNMQGMPENALLNLACYSHHFFTKNSKGVWKIDTPTEYMKKIGKKVELSQNNYYANFEEFLRERNDPSDAEQVELFADLLQKMLLIDPFRRITPEQALGHPFFSENKDGNNPIVKQVTGIANERSPTDQEPINLQNEKIVGKDSSVKYEDTPEEKERYDQLHFALECLKPKKTFFRSVTDFFSRIF